MPASNRYATLGNIKHPALVVHGTKDIVVLPINAFILATEALRIVNQNSGRTLLTTAIVGETGSDQQPDSRSGGRGKRA